MTGLRDPLGDRMKQYETVTRQTLPRRTYTVLRVDGRAFHTFLAHANKPWDDDVVRVMRATTQGLCGAVAGTVLGYTQSDEISLVLQDFESRETQPWFGGVVQKMASVAASTTTAIFLREYGAHFDPPEDDDYPTFDARVFTVPDVVEVANYLVWRQRDCARNSVRALAHAEFGPAATHGKNTGELRTLLVVERGITWETDVRAGLRRGWLCRKTGADVAGDPRTRWVTDAAPEFTADHTGELARLLPGPRTLT